MPDDPVGLAYNAILLHIDDETAGMDDDDVYAVMMRLAGEINSRIDEDEGEDYEDDFDDEE